MKPGLRITAAIVAILGGQTIFLHPLYTKMHWPGAKELKLIAYVCIPTAVVLFALTFLNKQRAK